ncbi:OLC1v1016938C1 [Oldenlandia corymbosa var. corymbosa]|uniref:OLC1v1016938C1 n=1 Tax=Oldenlandia corymbosa var. corymbosa TaxID=529605 RepID=A0AAV1E8B6_OLDCO|nr:OLC1v1016938C1 [Oldenlandia corymbosa var. corymbosa]
MDDRNWKDLGLDCLAEVFKWVGLETLLLSVPFVCKSWHKATLDPKCWQILIFPEIRCFEHFLRPMTLELVHSYALSCHDFPSLSFARFVVSRSHRSATELVLPGTCSWQVLEYVSDECPDLKFLGLSLEFLYKNGQAIENLIGKWKSLQALSIGNCYMLNEIFAQIQLHCKKFIGLIFCYSWIGSEEASAIASLPNIKYLSFRRAHIPQNNLHLILESCRSLELLELKQCSGFDCDNQMRRMTSHIKTIKYEESSSGQEYDEYSYYVDEEQARLAYNNWLHV